MKLSNHLQIKKVKQLTAAKTADKQQIHLIKKANYKVKYYYIKKLKESNE